MKACFLRAASRPTGTLDAALIFIPRTFDRGADLVAHPENTRAWVSVYIRFKSVLMEMHSNVFPSISVPFENKQRKEL